MAAVRILHLHSTFSLGGKEARAVRLMNHFGKRATHVILSAQPDAMDACNAIARGVEYSCPTTAPPLHGKPSVGRYRKFVDYFQKFDLILSYNWGAMDGVMARTLFSRVYDLPPLIHHEDGFNEDEWLRLKRKRNLFRMFALGGSQGLVVPSVTLQKIAREQWKQPESKIYRFPNGIDVSQYTKKPQRGSLPGFAPKQGEIVVGTVAGLRKVKNLPRLVRACAAIDNVRLVIVGEGPERGAIEAEAARLGMADRLFMPGFRADPHRIVGLFDIFALSSDSEQFPISLVEAMAAGLPVVTTDVGDIMSMVAKRNQPFITLAGDEAAFASALKKMVTDAKLRETLGQLNGVKAREEYNETKMLNRYARLYGQVMGRPDVFL